MSHNEKLSLPFALISPLFRMDNLISKMRIVLLKETRPAMNFPSSFVFVCPDIFERVLLCVLESE